MQSEKPTEAQVSDPTDGSLGPKQYDCQGRCPACGSDHISPTFGPEKYDDGESRDYKCDACGVEFEEFFVLRYSATTISRYVIGAKIPDIHSWLYLREDDHVTSDIKEAEVMGLWDEAIEAISSTSAPPFEWRPIPNTVRE